ncbi:MAG TPA: DUF3365 domain-containing protein [Pirellulales bacterium]|jgi:hypothetical protein|nr:DUF3365 domain-containing protein [Pirellulales bacterium]
MERNATLVFEMLAIFASFALTMVGAVAAPPRDGGQPAQTEQQSQAAPDHALPSVDEARARARLLHETVHATLQIVHHEYYREDEGLRLPAATLKSVFRELAARQKVELRWLVVDAEAMDVAHNPQNEFEKNAVKALGSGQDDYERAENGVYRHVGAITLSSECLKCHLPSRTSSKDRTAGLIIAMPVEKH